MSSRRMIGLLAVGVATVLAPSAPAEVRIRNGAGAGGAGVVIQSTLRGPWSPVGSIGPATLNPAGDLLGDSWPGTSAGVNVIAAWTRPGAGVLVAVGRNAWTAPRIVAGSEGACGSPHVTASGSDWLVAWPCHDGLPTTVLSGVAATGESAAPPVRLQGEALVGIAALPRDAISVATIDVDGTIQARSIVLAKPMPLPPIDWLSLGPSISIETIMPPIGIVDPVDHQALAASFSDVRLHSGTRHGEPYALLTWWDTPSELHWIELTEDGPALPVRTLRARGSVAHPQSLVQAAILEVSRR